jgi:D-alanyl-D-alanine carboxypeptidase/D-alanyl-D-alanine-endopeptidase (penicillin-binding protein 4)
MPPAVNTNRVAAALDSVPVEAGGDYRSAVIDLATHQTVWSAGGEVPVIAASTTKLMTAVAALDKLGPAATFATTVQSGGDGQIVLVGGGDPLLSSSPTSYPYPYPHPANLTDLASTTAAVLRAEGVASVSLGFDDSLFTGPMVHPDWLPDDLQYVARVDALMVDEASGGAAGPDPAAAAAQVFADLLQAQGITVTGSPVRASAVKGSAPLARITSLPLSELVQQALLHSDNTIAEVLFRQLAIAAGQPASFEGGAVALTAALTRLGLWQPGMMVSDGSGLSMAGRMTAQALASAVELAVSQPDLRFLLAGLPVAGGSGTLADRFVDPGAQAGRGFVRAKTGTLDAVTALVGYAPTQDGGLVAFAIVGNNVSGPAPAYLDDWSSALAGCACVG